MDWNNLILESVKYLLPIFLTMVIGWLGLLIKSEWENIKVKRPDIITAVTQYAPLLVHYIEQMRKIGVLPDSTTIRAEVELTLSNYLKLKGFNVDLTPYWDTFNSIVEAEVNKLPSDNVVVTKSVSTVESTPSKVVAPVKTSVKVAKNAAVEVSLPEIPSVVTTTTSVVSNSSSDSVAAVLAETPTSNSTDGSVG